MFLILLYGPPLGNSEGLRANSGAPNAVARGGPRVNNGVANAVVHGGRGGTRAWLTPLFAALGIVLPGGLGVEEAKAWNGTLRA